MANEEENKVKASFSNPQEENMFDKAASSVVKESDTSSTVTSETDPAPAQKSPLTRAMASIQNAVKGGLDFVTNIVKRAWEPIKNTKVGRAMSWLANTKVGKGIGKGLKAVGKFATVSQALYWLQ